VQLGDSGISNDCISSSTALLDENASNCQTQRLPIG